jgi:hypothetical protein
MLGFLVYLTLVLPSLTFVAHVVYCLLPFPYRYPKLYDPFGYHKLIYSESELARLRFTDELTKDSKQSSWSSHSKAGYLDTFTWPDFIWFIIVRWLFYQMICYHFTSMYTLGRAISNYGFVDGTTPSNDYALLSAILNVSTAVTLWRAMDSTGSEWKSRTWSDTRAEIVKVRKGAIESRLASYSAIYAYAAFCLDISLNESNFIDLKMVKSCDETRVFVDYVCFRSTMVPPPIKLCLRSVLEPRFIFFKSSKTPFI